MYICIILKNKVGFVRFEPVTYYSVVFLPVLLMYLLVALRMLERRKILLRDRPSFLSIVSVRDAALVTVALDLSELVGTFEGVFDFEGFSIPFVMVLSILLFHIIVYIKIVGFFSGSEGVRSKNPTRNILNMYFALALLMTNSVTVMDIMRAMGEGL